MKLSVQIQFKDIFSSVVVIWRNKFSQCSIVQFFPCSLLTEVAEVFSHYSPSASWFNVLCIQGILKDSEMLICIPQL